ncbi:MAG TPA: YoaK family protein [Acetobacteraceae bacterium]|nr:YoaK family protein [Acetobacteraceae bacterium]
MSRAALLLFLLSAASGAIDALSFIRFRVFTSAMSGNTVLLGIAIGQLHPGPAIAAAIALACFVLGVLAAIPLRTGGGAERGLRLVLLMEALFLAAFAALSFLHGPAGGALGSATVAVAAVGMGAQAVAARCVNLPGLPTVVFTSTLTAIAEALGRKAEGSGRRLPTDTWRQIGAFCCYLGGAGVGAALARLGAGASVLPLACALGALALALRGGTVASP